MPPSLYALTSSIKVYFELVLIRNYAKTLGEPTSRIECASPTNRPQLILNHLFVGFLGASSNIVKMGRNVRNTTKKIKYPNPKEDLISSNPQRKIVEKRKISSSKIEMDWSRRVKMIMSMSMYYLFRRKW